MLIRPNGSIVSVKFLFGARALLENWKEANGIIANERRALKRPTDSYVYAAVV